jgi:hypothetical protein
MQTPPTTSVQVVTPGKPHVVKSVVSPAFMNGMMSIKFTGVSRRLDTCNTTGLSSQGTAHNTKKHTKVVAL